MNDHLHVLAGGTRAEVQRAAVNAWEPGPMPADWSSVETYEMPAWVPHFRSASRSPQPASRSGGIGDPLLRGTR